MEFGVISPHPSTTQTTEAHRRNTTPADATSPHHQSHHSVTPNILVHRYWPQRAIALNLAKMLPGRPEFFAAPSTNALDGYAVLKNFAHVGKICPSIVGSVEVIVRCTRRGFCEMRRMFPHVPSLVRQSHGRTEPLFSSTGPTWRDTVCRLDIALALPSRPVAGTADNYSFALQTCCYRR